MIYGPYQAKCVAVHDGDTIYFDIDTGFAHFVMSHDFSGKPLMACRVYGINAPELSTLEGQAALAFAQSILKPGDICQVTSVKWDKYGGRFDGIITLPNGQNFATEMLSSGNAVVYNG